MESPAGPRAHLSFLLCIIFFLQRMPLFMYAKRSSGVVASKEHCVLFWENKHVNIKLPWPGFVSIIL